MVIDDILKARNIREILNVSDFKKECIRIAKLIHPDVCSNPKAHDAFTKFQELKALFENGFSFQDDSGTVTIKESALIFDVDAIQQAYSNNMFNKIHINANENFRKYFPFTFSSTREPYYSLIGVSLPEEHVMWVLNRLLEFCAYMEQAGYVHLGINLESFLVNPKDHSINVISFYHTVPIGSKISTISSKYAHWYPPSLFVHKVAVNSQDVTVVKSLACSLLGDASGRGIKLKGKVSNPLLNFLISSHSDAFTAMDEYKKMLKANYESKFHILNL